jgi:hypothetical protein
MFIYNCDHNLNANNDKRGLINHIIVIVPRITIIVIKFRFVLSTF